MASSNSTVRVIEVSEVTPPSDSPETATELSLPLTFFDTFWIKFHPVERIFFYQLTDSTPAIFNSTIIPNLKHSLSLALQHYLPLAGKLIWPSHAAKPFISYSPPDTAISVSVAESQADFHRLSGNEIRDTVASHAYIPHLHVSEATASIIAFQITLFPNQGFCIGVSSHHAILDGKSVTMFMKAWAYLCRSLNENGMNSNPSLSPELTPFFDRTVIQDPDGIDVEYLKNWSEFASKANLDHNPRSLRLIPFLDFSQTPELNNRVRGTFELSGEDIKRLRQKVLLLHGQVDKAPCPMHLSTFVLSYAYVTVTIFKAKEIERNKKVLLIINADCRARLDPPISTNYVGNCVVNHPTEFIEAEILLQENGLCFVVEKLSEGIKMLEKGALEGAKEKLKTFMAMDPDTIGGIGTAGSPRFGVYATDFGWGRPKKVEVASIDRTPVTISMAESRDGTGVEVGFVSTQHEMEIFGSLFVNGLKDI